MPEFRFVATDENNVSLVVHSNNGSDKGIYLKNAKKKKMDRPILFQVQGETSSYRYVSFALTVDETKSLIKELNRMVDYLEDI